MKNKVSKYEIEWQLLRSSLKGELNGDLHLKMKRVVSFFKRNPTYERGGRIRNWIEGLIMGLKRKKDTSSLEEHLDYFSSLPMKREEIDEASQLKILKEASKEEVIVLWNDLFNTNKKWLKKGYLHRECNQFMDWLYFNREDILSSSRFSYKELLSLREESKNKKNTHKFLF